MTTPLPAQKTAANFTYRESGRSDAPALVLLHGIGSTSAGWRAEVIQWITSAEGLNAEGYAQAARMLAAADVPREIVSVTCPVRVVSGEKDTRTPPETNANRIAAAAPNATLQRVPDCGHLPHLEHPEVFNAAVLEALRALGQTRAA
jgi:pimeloyl-ACP methyl ester carboxylesterase